jgi:hypothetical protein
MYENTVVATSCTTLDGRKAANIQVLIIYQPVQDFFHPQ